jgi:PAS domain-containing protein
MPIIQNLLRNPLLVKMALLAFFCVFLFLAGIIFIRKLRRDIESESKSPLLPESGTGFSLATYNGLAGKLRDKEKELRELREQYQADSAMAAGIQETVLGNLSCGVIFFDRTGLLRQANRAAKSLLGYSSPFSFHIRDLFRGVSRLCWRETGEEAQSAAPLNQALQETLRTGAAFPRMRVDYRSPSGQKRVLGLSAFPVQRKNGEILGVSCLIDDLTEIAELSQEVHRSENLASLGEISAGLIHDFKKSLATVRTQAQSLLQDHTDPATYVCAGKIVAEIESLSRIADEFLDFAASNRE